MRIVLMGMPGVGKGTQAARLRDRLGVIHVSTGDILREAVKNGTALGRKARGFMDGGGLVPDELMGEMIGERLARDDAKAGFILDGFPRTVAQVGILDDTLDRVGVALDGVVLFEAPESEVKRRLTGRRVCPGCGSVFHIENNPPKSQGVCDGCGSALVQRPDDTESVIEERLRVYRQDTLPIAETYEQRGVLLRVDATGSPDAVAGRVKQILEMQGASEGRTGGGA